MNHNFTLEEFKKFAKDTAPILSRPGPNSDSKHGYKAPRLNLTHEQLLNYALTGSVDKKREISRMLYDAGTLYTQLIEYYASMHDFTYFASAVEFKNKKTLKNITKVLQFADSLKATQTFNEILRTELIEGCYYGVLCYDKDLAYSFVLQIPYKFVQVLGDYSPGFKAFAIKLDWFSQRTEEELIPIFERLPDEMVSQIRSGEKLIKVPVNACVGFELPNGLPPFFFAISSFFDYLDKIKMDKKKIEQELIMLLVQTLPLRNDGELIFSLDEATELHRNLSNILRQNGLADAVTTFGKIEAVNVDSNISNNNDPVEKALKAIPTNAGLMSSLFIPQSSADLKIAIQKDSAYVIKLVERYNNWLLYQARFIEKSLTLKFLPITWENHTDYFNRVRAKFDFGLNKILFAMSDGLKQSEVLAQIFIEEAYDLANLITPQQNANTLTNAPDQDAKKSQSDTHDTNSQAVEGEEEKVEPAE